MAKTRIEIARRIAGVIAIVLGVALTGFAETVTNVRGAQRENSKLVDIYYDLNDTDGGTYYVEVEVVGKTSAINATSFSGDVGDGISPGQDRRIVWDAGADWPGNKGDVKAVVTAIRGGKPNKVQLWEGGPYWADRNIGADNPWDYGLYFWWGDTTGYRPSGTTFSFSFTSSNCPTKGKSTDQLRSEGWITSNVVLAPNHDAAHVHWGGRWRMPTYQELADLCYNKCDWTSTTMNGVNGYIIRGRDTYSPNSIFLPCAGIGDGTSLSALGSFGCYWSSSSYSGGYNASEIYFYSNNRGRGGNLDCGRWQGRPVRPVQDGSTPETATSSSEWFFVDTTDKPEVLVHFNANGGVFRDKDGNDVTQFDQYFTYGEAQRLFTDELTPMKMDADGNANHFLGWVCGSSAMASSAYLVDYLIDGRAMKTWDTDVSEVTLYAVWTATLTISYYNRSDNTLSPSSLADHLTWRTGSPDSPTTGKSGEPVQIRPGTPNIYLLIDDDYKWVAGQIKFVGRYGVANTYYDPSMCALHNIEIRGGQEYSIDVEVRPSQEFALEGEVVFWHSCAVREELRNLINSQRGNLPDFDPSKVRISIGRAEFNPAGNDYVPAKTGGLTGLELYKFYWLPVGFYYLKDVTYDTDTSSGDPYWGAVLGPTSARLIKSRLIQVRNDDDEVITEYTINFDVFGGAKVARAIFDSRKGECAKSEAWFPNAAEGIRVVSEKALPTPERSGFDFIGWFTEKDGGIKLKEGAAIPSNKVHWNIPDSIEAFDHTFTVYAQWTNMTDEWVNELFPELVFDFNVDVATIATTTAANGKLTVAQCYSCGVNPTDPKDDLKITDFEMKDGKPVITLNHTEDGSGNSFLPRVKTLGKATLSDAEEWREVPEEGDPSMRFFKVEVEMP